VPAIMDTAAEIAPVAPANTTTWLLVELAATPKTSPKIDTVRLCRKKSVFWKKSRMEPEIGKG